MLVDLHPLTMSSSVLQWLPRGGCQYYYSYLLSVNEVSSDCLNNSITCTWTSIHSDAKCNVWEPECFEETFTHVTHFYTGLESHIWTALLGTLISLSRMMYGVVSAFERYL